MKNLIFVSAVILGAVYIAFGDQIAPLPQPMKTTSYQTRTAITNFGAGLVPGWAKKDQNKRTQDAIDKEQKGQPATQ